MVEYNKSILTADIKCEALRLGFDDCGVACADFLADEQPRFEAWLQQGMNAEMAYMANNVEKRFDPRLLVDGAKSIICVLMNYKPPQPQHPQAARIARYAYGNDYHDIIRHKLNQLLQYIQQQVPEATGRSFADSAPVLERAWAVRAGLGWIGKNSTLISPKHGSFTFIAELIITIELDYDKPYSSNGCGACNRCMANCPTGAICAPRTVDARRCISYQTIENKGDIMVDTNGWLFGCDICLQVCPWNKRTAAHNKPELEAIPRLLTMTVDDWVHLTENDFTTLLKHSPIKRAKFAGIKRNLKQLHKRDEI